MLKITLTKISDTTHVFSYERESGGGESVELETRSFLLHDLIHFVVESEAYLGDSFYGRLAQGSTYDDLKQEGMEHTDETEIADVERIVGPLTGVIKDDATPKQCMEGLTNLYTVYDREPPEWVNISFISVVKEKVQTLLNEWNRTPFGEAMELTFIH